MVLKSELPVIIIISENKIKTLWGTVYVRRGGGINDLKVIYTCYIMKIYIKNTVKSADLEGAHAARAPCSPLYVFILFAPPGPIISRSAPVLCK